MILNIARKIRSKIKNKTLLRAVRDSKEKGYMTDDLVQIFTKMARKKAMNWRYNHLTYNEDMQAYAMMTLCRTWDKFNLELSDNPYSYYIVAIKSAFIQYSVKEIREDEIKKELQNIVDDEHHF